jgi:SAM-dependent methyltransferase
MLLDRLREALTYPELRDLDLDGPEITIRRREIARRDPPTRYAFSLWYKTLAEAGKAAPQGLHVEVGAGGGFLEEFIPGLIKTEVEKFPFTDIVCRAEEMPFADETVACLYMVNVLHHIEEPAAFFREAARVLCPGGRIVMIEPTVTPFSRLIYTYLHHEPFDPETPNWNLPPAGRLTGGNDAMPWIIFWRDRGRFEEQFSCFHIKEAYQHDCLVHFLSGGVTTRSFLPIVALQILAALEKGLFFLGPVFGLFQTVIVEKTDETKTR